MAARYGGSDQLIFYIKKSPRPGFLGYDNWLVFGIYPDGSFPITAYRTYKEAKLNLKYYNEQCNQIDDPDPWVPIHMSESQIRRVFTGTGIHG